MKLLDLMKLARAAPTTAPPTLAPVEYDLYDLDEECRKITAEIERLHGRISKARVRMAHDPDVDDYVAFMEDLVREEEGNLVRARARVDRDARDALRVNPAEERRIEDALLALDRRHGMAHAEALAGAIREAGGPKTARAWSRDGVGARVYLPEPGGFLYVTSGGGVYETVRGKLVFNGSSLYPSWRRGVRAGRAAYAANWLARHEANTAERGALMAELRRGSAQRDGERASSARAVRHAGRDRQPFGLWTRGVVRALGYESAEALHRDHPVNLYDRWYDGSSVEDVVADLESP